MAERVVLVRHGETEWSSARRHTGRTDIPLNDEGRRLAAALQPVLAGITGMDDALVLTSPLRRARDTCALAGLGDRAEIVPDLVEWDYGTVEGRRTDELRLTVPGWSVWTHDPDGGETVDEVGARADRVLERIHAEDRLVVAFAHAHMLRILTARWCRLDPRAGRMFMLDPASVSILGHERETRCIERWNLVTTGDLERFREEPQPARRRHAGAQRALGPEANGPS
jgi:broad specificity phosphatase PhoE